MQHSATQRNTMQHSATQRNAAQRNTTHHNTAQHNTPQHNEIDVPVRDIVWMTPVAVIDTLSRQNDTIFRWTEYGAIQ